MTKHVQPSPQSRVTLLSLQQAVSEALDRKRRLGQYAVVWQDGAPVMVGGEIDEMDEQALLAERTFLRNQVVALPESEQKARTNALARLDKIEVMIAAKHAVSRQSIEQGRPGATDDSVSV